MGGKNIFSLILNQHIIFNLNSLVSNSCAQSKKKTLFPQPKELKY